MTKHSRLIDAEWLKESLHNFFTGNFHPITEDDIMAYIDAAQTEQMWIPVSERLPKLGHRVLFKMWNNDVYIGILLKLNDGLKITLEPTGIEYVYSFENVIAWMSLPE